MNIRSVAIIGMGLLGTSLGMALRNKGYRRIAWARRPAVRQWVLDHDAADVAYEDIRETLAQADLTVFSLPVPATIEYLERYADAWKPGALVTDIGSVKGVVMDAAEKFLTPRGIEFTGSHPMAGTEKSGCEHAFPELYNNADIFICPGSLSRPEHTAELEKFWRAVDMKPVTIGIQEHDELVAHTSHVLHMVASALALTILGASSEQEKARRFAGCATGFRDTSRIASSNPAMWREIMENNTPAVLKALKDFETGLKEISSLIEQGRFDEFEEEFGRGKALRDSWLKYKGY